MRPPPLAGRGSEIAALRQSIRDAATGTASTLLVSGEAGIGKTALLRQAEAEPVRLFRAACLPLTSLASPLLPLRQLYGFGGTDPLADFDSWLDRQAAEVPTLLVVDDLHWADDSTLDVLLYVIAGRSDRRLVVAATRRSGVGEDRLRRWLADVRRLPRVSELHLARLDRADTRDQLGGLLGAPPHESLVDDVQARAAGNPYLAGLLVRDLPPDARALPAGLPAELRDALARQWQGMSAAARTLTGVIAVGGQPRRDFPPADAPLLREAVGAGVLRTDPDGRYWFVHPLLAEVLVGEFLPEERRELHAAFAAESEPDSRDIAGIVNRADHYHRAGLVEPAYRWALRAAAATAGGAEQLRLLRRALELWPAVAAPGRMRTQLLRDIRSAAARGGHAVDELAAVEDLLRAERHPLHRAELLVGRAQLHFRLGIEFAGVAGLAEAVRISAGRPRSAEHALATAELAGALLWHGDPAAEQLVERALRLARASGSERALLYALIAGAQLPGPDGIHRAREALDLAVRIRDFAGFIRAAYCLANVLGAERNREVGEVHRQARARLVELGAPHTYVSDLYAAEAAELLDQGRWWDCRDRLRVALGATPSRFADVAARLTAALLAARQGRPVEAAAHLGRAEELFQATSGFLGMPFDVVRAELAVAAGQHRRAYDRALAGLTAQPPPNWVERLLPLACRALADQAQTARDRSADPSGPLADLAELRQRFPRVVSDWGEYARAGFYRRRLRAMQAHSDAETARARRTTDEPCCWQLAARACEAAELPWDEAYCRWREAQALSRDRSTRRAAVAALRRAYRPAMDLQAEPLLDDLRAIATGLHVAPDDPRPRVPAPRPALPGLTSREWEILAHVVAGRTNNEIARAFVLSDKTVSTHVSNMLRKTGTANRRELAELARRLTNRNRVDR